MSASSSIYEGMVHHTRLRPKVHALHYRVFCLCLDVDELSPLARRLWLFSHNQFNAVSFYDADHGGRDGKSIAVHARDTFTAAGLTQACSQIKLLCYPRIFGYGFNPISVFYGYDSAAKLAGVIYEVNNTFGHRRSYVVPIDGRDATDGIYFHGCAKELYVSPFNGMEIDYRFRLKVPLSDVLVAVSLKDRAGALLKTHFCGMERELCDYHLARLLITIPLLTLKVMAAIHFEALRLWLKGVPITPIPNAPTYSVTHCPPLSKTQPATSPG